MRRVRVAVIALGLLWALAACGDDPARDGAAPTEPTTTTGQPQETDPPAQEPGPEPVRVQVTVSGHDVSPSGERVEAEVGQPVVFVITADEPGELHVHTSPEQEIVYEAGRSQHELVVERPGVVEVESHEAHTVVVQLEVR